MANDEYVPDNDSNRSMSDSECKDCIKVAAATMLVISGIGVFVGGLTEPSTREGKIMIGAGVFSTMLGILLFADECCGIRFRALNFARSCYGYFTRSREPERRPLFIKKNTENNMERGELVPVIPLIDQSIPAYQKPANVL